MPRPNVHQEQQQSVTGDASQFLSQFPRSRVNQDRAYGMDIRQPPVGENVHGVRVEREEADWARNKPLNVDYNQLERDTLANRQRVGWVPKGDRYIPASVANLQGYFNDPNAPGKSYFETNPEFKTFFPNDPYYAGLASLNEWQRSGGDIYDETHSMGPGYWGSYRPSTQNISMNLGEDLDEWVNDYYGDYGPNNKRGYRDTLLHEMMHHWSRQPGVSGETPKELFKTFSREGHPDVVTTPEAMWNPLYSGSSSLDAEQVEDFMRMHRLGKREYQGYNTGGLASLML